MGKKTLVEAVENTVNAEKNPPAKKKVSVSVPISDSGASVEIVHKVKKIVEEKHPIAFAMDTFLHRVMDILHAANVFIPLSIQNDKNEMDDIKKNLEEAKEAFATKNKDLIIVTQRKILENLSRLERCKESKVPTILKHSLFVNLFSMFDAYTGDLLTALFTLKGDLYNSVNRSFTLSDLLTYKSFEDIKVQALQLEIESFRRKSYVEQFKDLENMFGIKLSKFSKWPDFVECSQRRNLLTHCDGVISSQYLNICKEHGCQISEKATLGAKIDLGTGYLFSVCNLMMEVAFRLGQTLWRKVLPEELEKADEHLIETIYLMLEREEWKKAEEFSEFGLNLPKLSSDLIKKMIFINHCIAIKFGQSNKKYLDLLKQEDWSASLNEFKLANAVLLDDFPSAVLLMKKIGVAGDLLSETSYHVWPLFKEYRESEPFLSAYEEIYGHPFKVELQRRAEAAELDELTELQETKLATAIQQDSVQVAEADKEPPIKRTRRRKSSANPAE